MMANTKGRRRRFGAIRQLKSGQWQARYRGPDGLLRPADHTFSTKTDADLWLTRKEAEILNGTWIDPELGKVKFADYAVTWIDERPGLRPKTLRLYRYLLRLHLVPSLGQREIADINEAAVRRWRKELIDSGVSEITTAKAYRLLKAVLSTAVDDGMIRRNPCRIKSAGQEDSAERPVLTITQVYALANAIAERYRALVLLAAFASLRWGELAALRPCDIDLESCVIRVSRQLTEVDGRAAFGPPKSTAGRRNVSIPDVILPDIHMHLTRFGPRDQQGLVFTSPHGTWLRHSNFYRRAWMPAVTKAGLASIHFHDLRHAGNALSADAGANLRELMDRMGHSTTRAALIYLHSTSARQRTIATSISERTQAELQKAADDGGPASQSGTDVARSQRHTA